VSLLVTGSIGIDTVKTPHGVSEECIGGAAVYFSMAASFFCPVRFVGVIGDDCPFDLAKLFSGRNVDLAGLEIRPGSKTFRWMGTYHEDMDSRTTDYVELNVLGEAPPKVPAAFKDSRFVFLANTAPKLQHELLDQVAEPEFVAADTMNLWIQGHLDELKALLKRIDCLIINEDEARMLAGDQNLIAAARRILGMGLWVVVIKKGASGSLVCDVDGNIFVLPAYPAEKVVDPTGAGDSFAGGLMGCLADSGRSDFQTLTRAVAYGTVVASYTISDFSLKGLIGTSREHIERRIERLRKVTSF